MRQHKEAIDFTSKHGPGGINAVEMDCSGIRAGLRGCAPEKFMVQVVDGPTVDHQSGRGRLVSDPAGTTIEVDYDLTFRLPMVVDGKNNRPALQHSDPTVSITALNGKTIPAGNYFLYDDEKGKSYHLTNYAGEGWILLEH